MNALTESRTIVRASSLPMYADCPRRWAARHLRREIEGAGYALNDLPGGVGAFVGTSVHAGAGHMLIEKMEQGRLPLDPRDSADLAVATFDPLVEDGVVWDAATGSLNDAHKQIARMVRAYWLERAPDVEPVEIEQRMEKTYPDDPSIILSGQGDVFEDGGVDDLKTGTGRRANAAQYGAYSLLRRSAGHHVTRITETYVPRAPIRREQPPVEVHEIPVETAEQAAWATLTAAVNATKQFRETGDSWAFLPNPASTLCSAKFCPAYGADFCKAHKGAKA